MQTQQPEKSRPQKTKRGKNQTNIRHFDESPKIHSDDQIDRFRNAGINSQSFDENQDYTSNSNNF